MLRLGAAAAAPPPHFALLKRQATAQPTSTPAQATPTTRQAAAATLSPSPPSPALAADVSSRSSAAAPASAPRSSRASPTASGSGSTSVAAAPASSSVKHRGGGKPSGASSSSAAGGAGLALPSGSGAADGSSPGLGTGALIGIIAGGAAVGLLVIGVAIWFCTKRKRRKQEAAYWGGVKENGKAASLDGRALASVKPHRLPDDASLGHSSHDTFELSEKRSTARTSSAVASPGFPLVSPTASSVNPDREKNSPRWATFLHSTPSEKRRKAEAEERLWDPPSAAELAEREAAAATTPTAAVAPLQSPLAALDFGPSVPSPTKTEFSGVGMSPKVLVSEVQGLGPNGWERNGGKPMDLRSRKERERDAKAGKFVAGASKVELTDGAAISPDGSPVPSPAAPGAGAQTKGPAAEEANANTATGKEVKGREKDGNKGQKKTDTIAGFMESYGWDTQDRYSTPPPVPAPPKPDSPLLSPGEPKRSKKPSILRRGPPPLSPAATQICPFPSADATKPSDGPLFFAIGSPNSPTYYSDAGSPVATGPAATAAAATKASGGATAVIGNGWLGAGTATTGMSRSTSVKRKPAPAALALGGQAEAAGAGATTESAAAATFGPPASLSAGTSASGAGGAAAQEKAARELEAMLENMQTLARAGSPQPGQGEPTTAAPQSSSPAAVGSAQSGAGSGVAASKEAAIPGSASSLSFASSINAPLGLPSSPSTTTSAVAATLKGQLRELDASVAASSPLPSSSSPYPGGIQKTYGASKASMGQGRMAPGRGVSVASHTVEEVGEFSFAHSASSSMSSLGPGTAPAVRNHLGAPALSPLRESFTLASPTAADNASPAGNGGMKHDDSDSDGDGHSDSFKPSSKKRASSYYGLSYARDSVASPAWSPNLSPAPPMPQLSSPASSASGWSLSSDRTPTSATRLIPSSPSTSGGAPGANARSGSGRPRVQVSLARKESLTRTVARKGSLARMGRSDPLGALSPASPASAVAAAPPEILLESPTSTNGPKPPPSGSRGPKTLTLGSGALSDIGAALLSGSDSPVGGENTPSLGTEWNFGSSAPATPGPATPEPRSSLPTATASVPAPTPGLGVTIGPASPGAAGGRKAAGLGVQDLERDGFVPLNQMRLNADDNYRSATYSIYGMYDGESSDDGHAKR